VSNLSITPAYSRDLFCTAAAQAMSVPTTAALRLAAQTAYPWGIWRLGVSAPGDSGIPQFYAIDTGSVCSVDDGNRCVAAAGGGFWLGQTSATFAAGTFATITASGQITSTVSTGTAPLVVASTTNVANLNASTLTGDAVGTSGATIPLLNGNNAHSGNETHSGTEGFTGAVTLGEMHGTIDTAVLTGNNYTTLAGDCGHTKLLPTGTTPTITLSNINPASGVDCKIKFITTAAISYHFIAASGGSIINSQAFSHTRGANAGDTVIVDLVTPSATAAKWNISGDLTS
jgi:hypothetical protein